MAYNEILIAGFGGQGVMSMGTTMAEAALSEGLNVSWLPSYGPEMRGGTANCSVVIADSEIISPIVLQPSELIVMNLPSLDKFEPTVKPGGYVFVNDSIIKRKLVRTDIKAIYVPTLDIADELGNMRVANMVMLGSYIEATGVLKFDTVVNMLRNIFTGKKAHLVEINQQALQRGAACVKI